MATPYILQAAAGSATKPALAFAAETGLGFYRKEAGVLSFAANGGERLRMGGNLTIVGGATFFATDVSGGVASGDTVIANAKMHRAVTSFATTQPLIGLSAADKLVLGFARGTATTPGDFSATRYLEVVDKDGNTLFIPAADAAW